MIFHASFSARNPRQVTTAIAELWGGGARQLPSVGRGSWIAEAQDGAGTRIEVYADGDELQPDRLEAVAVRGVPRRFSATRLTIASRLSEAEVLTLADRESWLARRSRRSHGEQSYTVIELWVENRLLLEVLTEDMQRDYVAVTSAANGVPVSEPLRFNRAA